MKVIVVATGNRGKVKEISAILCDFGFNFRSLKDYPPAAEPEENADSFAGNAAIKALAAAERTGELSLADDSGLVVDALDGAPGIYSNRFAGEDVSDAERINKILELMKDVPDDKRSARFVAAIAIAEPGRVIGTAEGTCEGKITHYPQGWGGFGYDPIFLVDEYNRTMAELDAEDKNRISHRGKALENVKSILSNL